MKGFEDGSVCVWKCTEKVQKGLKRSGKVKLLLKECVCNSGIAFFSRRNLGERRWSVTFGFRRASLCRGGSRAS
jgi:hypothetical protein